MWNVSAEHFHNKMKLVLTEAISLAVDAEFADLQQNQSRWCHQPLRSLRFRVVKGAHYTYGKAIPANSNRHAKIISSSWLAFKRNVAPLHMDMVAASDHFRGSRGRCFATDAPEVLL